MRIERVHLDEFLTLWRNSIDVINDTCTCGAKLDLNNVRDAWKNDPQFAWLYVECVRCGYQWALWKLIRRKKVTN
jgi:hypothetical protein